MSRIAHLSELALECPLWKNPRIVTGLGTKDLEDLGADIMDRGQVQDVTVLRVLVPRVLEEGAAPPEVDPNADEGTVPAGLYEVELVIDGQRRVMGLTLIAKKRKKGLGSVEVRVTDYAPEWMKPEQVGEPIILTPEIAEKITLDMVAGAVKRKGLSSYEQLEVAWGLRQADEKKSLDNLAAAIGRSESWLSRMLRARKVAGPTLLEKWSKGDLTDEQFKELAEAGGYDKQEEAITKVLEIKARGDRQAATEARNASKEIAAKAKADREKEKAKDKDDKPKAAKKASRPTIRPPAVKEIWAFGLQKKPSDPYVKGLMHGAGYAMGEVTPDEFASPWRTYVKQLQKAGLIEVPEQPKKKAKKASKAN